MIVTIRTIIGTLVPISVAVGATGYFMGPRGGNTSTDRDDFELRSTVIAGAACIGTIAALIVLGGYVR